ncbi:MAG: DUF3301 domain-containing protein [Burkholderiales bacterium]
MLEIAIVAALVAAGWFLWSSLQAREAGNAAIRPACQARGYLFLDDTVALDRLRLRRDDEGRARIERTYRFDYSDTGDNRRRGYVTLLGARVLEVSLGPAVVDAPPR